MITRIKCDKIVLSDGITDGYVYVSDGRIVDVTSECLPCDEEHDLTGLYLFAGFIELHSHGGGGYAFTESSEEEVLNGCEFHLRHGTTTILPTVSAGSYEVMRAALENIHKAKNSGKCRANILGAHLEGPYLSAKQCGAQCPRFITPPIKEEYESLINDFEGSVRRWTYAPENDKDGEFCRYITERSILASAGHTDATYDDMLTAVKNGCKLITHLYSCTSTVTRNMGFRSLGVIESAYLLDELFVEIIADGKHLPPELIQMIIKVKGKERVAAISDSLSIAGSDQTSGIMSGTEFIVEDGVAKLPDRSAFAGSVATADVLMRVLVNSCGYSIPEASGMLSNIPAKILGEKKGSIEKGYDADLTATDTDFNARAVFVAGSRVV